MVRVLDTNPTIRPIRAADLELEKAFVDGLSPATGYQRLMSTRRLSMEELRRFTDIDTSRETALIATLMVDGRERQVGVARYVREERAPDTAEFAIVLADAWHGRGLGRSLLTSLVQAARNAGIRRIFGTTLSTNGAMLALARKMGFKAAFHPESAAITMLTLDLGGQAASTPSGTPR